MSEVVREGQQEFWRPPVAAVETVRPGMVEVCGGCSSEFMVGSLYCHTCGASRETQATLAAHWTLYLQFHNIKRALGLPTASLIAFLAGIVCLIMASIAVGMIYSVQTFNDFQAVQWYRMQWLLGAIAAFAAGMLLRKSPEIKR